MTPLERKVSVTQIEAESSRASAERAHAEALEVKGRAQAQVRDLSAALASEKEARAAIVGELNSLKIRLQFAESAINEHKERATTVELQLSDERTAKEALAQRHEKRCYELEETAAKRCHELEDKASRAPRPRGGTQLQTCA